MITFALFLIAILFNYKSINLLDLVYCILAKNDLLIEKYAILY